MMLGHYCHDCPLVAEDPAFRHARAFFGTHSYIMHRRGLHKIFAYPHLMPIEKQIDAGESLPGILVRGVVLGGVLECRFAQIPGACLLSSAAAGKTALAACLPPGVPQCLRPCHPSACLSRLRRLQCWATCASRAC